MLGTVFVTMAQTLGADLDALVELSEVVLGVGEDQRTVLGADQLEVGVALKSFANSPPQIVDPPINDFLLNIGNEFFFPLMFPWLNDPVKYHSTYRDDQINLLVSSLIV